MAIGSRTNKTAYIQTQGTETEDGAGGVRPGTPTVVATGYTFYLFNVTAFDRLQLLTRNGLESDAIVHKCYGELNDYIAVGNELVVSATEIYEVIGVSDQDGRTATPHHLAFEVLRRRVSDAS